MTRTTGFLVGILIITGLCWIVSRDANAQVPLYNVSHNGTPQFSANNLTISGTTYNFTDSTPPPPVNDPNALNIIIGKYTSHACSNFSTSTGQDFGSTFGEGVTVWPYHPSTGVSMTLPPHGRYYGGIINAGQNPGITPHYLKGDPYAGSCVPRLYSTVGARVNVRVVPVGNTPAPTGRCSIAVAAFDATPWIWLKFAGPPNTSHCLGVIGGAYRYIVENNGTTNIVALMTFN